MKNVMTSAVLAMGVVVGAMGSAYAASSSYCAQQAQNAVYAYTHPVGNAVAGCAIGGILGNVLSGGNSGATAGGCAAGAATGLILSNTQRQKIYNNAYSQCMGSGGGGGGYAPLPQPVVAGPPPSGFATVYVQLNVRSGPGGSYPTIFTLAPYSTVAVSQCTQSWCLVGDANANGWASRKYLFFN
jgi:hypothetical protein